MTLTLGTDTFTTVSEADAYMQGRLHADSWNGTNTAPAPDSAKKEAALRMATAILNRERYAGRITAPSQPLAWPRTGVTDQEGRIIPSATIPEAVKTATAELALILLATDLSDERTRRALFRVKSERIGESAQAYEANPGSNDSLPAFVREMIAPFLARGGSHSSRLVP